MILEKIKLLGDELMAPNFRALIYLGISLYDYQTNNWGSPSETLLKQFEALLKLSLKQSDESVALHAVRAFFHTRNPIFVKRVIDLYKELPEEWRNTTYHIYWNEVQKLISEAKQNHKSPAEIMESISHFSRWFYPIVLALPTSR